MPSVLQPWVEEIGLRHQGVLLSACRGCDIAPRHDPSKIAQRLLRGAILVPHCGREVKPASYIHIEEDLGSWWECMRPFLSSWDHYPNHYVVHFIHAAEVIGYHGPVSDGIVFAERWLEFYYKACHILHFNPETKEQLSERLDADEAKFRELQKIRGW